MQASEEDTFEQAIELQLQGKLFEKGSVESLLPVHQAAVSLVEDVEEVVSEFEEEETADDVDWEADIEDLDKLLQGFEDVLP